MTRKGVGKVIENVSYVDEDSRSMLINNFADSIQLFWTVS